MSNHINIGDFVYTINDWDITKYICVDMLDDKYKLMIPGLNNISFWVSANQVWK